MRPGARRAPQRGRPQASRHCRPSCFPAPPALTPGSQPALHADAAAKPSVAFATSGFSSFAAAGSNPFASVLGGGSSGSGGLGFTFGGAPFGFGTGATASFGMFGAGSKGKQGEEEGEGDEGGSAEEGNDEVRADPQETRLEGSRLTLPPACLAIGRRAAMGCSLARRSSRT